MRRSVFVVALAWVLLCLLAGGCGVTDNEPCRRVHYLDDMEDAGIVQDFSVMREAWVPASVPAGYRWEDNRRIGWYVKDREVGVEDLFPDAQPGPGEGFLPVLEINFRDAQYPGKGYDPEGQWGGLMKLITAAGSDYSDMSYLEIWLRRKQGSGGRMHIDLGDVSENFYNPWEADSLHTEDKDRDGELSSTENTGLDGVFTGEAGDDPYDDWAFSEGDYSQMNGTEQNPRTVPDTEDLDGDNHLDTDDIHFSLAFDLDDPVYIVREVDEWKLYRVPLAEAEEYGGYPTWDAIRYMRFFFTETDSPAVYQMAYLRLTGSTWVNEGVHEYWGMSPISPPTGEVFQVGAKNTRDDPDYLPPYDPGKDPQGYMNREQSMMLFFTVEAPWHCGAAHRSLGRTEDFSLYDSLSFYVHGDDVPVVSYAFVRLGADSLNFYECGMRVLPGWNRVGTGFDELRAVESHAAQERTLYGNTVAFRGSETAGGWIWIYGEPALDQVSWIGAGLVLGAGPAPGPTPLEVWLDDFCVTVIK